ncbi:ABC transporter substrate-binding protein [Cohnella faecalis]|nr:sugar ABC transporter substrate-binding protein [Cohnella faecalis]
MNNRKWLKVLLLVLVCCLCVSLAACQSKENTNNEASGTSGKQPSEKTTIKMWTFLDPNGTSAREVALKQIITNFERDNPNVKVAVEPQVWDTLGTKFLAANQTGNAPDVIWTSMDDFGTALKQNALVDFESLFLNSWTPEDIKDIDDAYWAFGNKDGKHYQVTLSRNYIGILYREDLLAEKGIKVPFKTWDELIDAAVKLTEKDAATGIQRYGFGQAFSPESPDPQVFPPSLIQSQGDMFTEGGKANWSTDAGVTAMNRQLDMVTKYKVTPDSAISSSVEDVYNEFKAGRYAMMIGAGVRIPTLQKESTFDGSKIQMTYFPSEDGSTFSPSVINGWNVGVWSGSKNKEAAGKFVEHMINAESDEIWMTVGGQVPVRKSTVQKNADFLSKPDKTYLSVMAEGFAKYGYAQPWEFPVSGWRADLNKIAQDILVKGKDVKAALQAAEKEFNERAGS